MRNDVSVGANASVREVVSTTFRSSAFSPTLFVGEKVAKPDEGALASRDNVAEQEHFALAQKLRPSGRQSLSRVRNPTLTPSIR
jgi:hypothetical protein